MEGVPPGFSPEEHAALQWVLGEKEREPTKVFFASFSLQEPLG